MVTWSRRRRRQRQMPDKRSVRDDEAARCLLCICSSVAVAVAVSVSVSTAICICIWICCSARLFCVRILYDYWRYPCKLYPRCLYIHTQTDIHTCTHTTYSRQYSRRWPFLVSMRLKIKQTSPHFVHNAIFSVSLSASLSWAAFRLAGNEWINRFLYRAFLLLLHIAN